ncbi:microtubule -associated protein EB1 [Achlya hypogyna]|uniref:Microtubule-associated protein EB1 n=1 Tax=Achlya hypogyna TaxID=1202772 RepID=A0A1V9YAL4_ACHHY|nr:microtubule -associated protein EB1 [Achlya hypogyna]
MSDQAIGMMDGAYFVGRKEILDWVNTTCGLGLTKVEQTCTGAVACMILDAIYPGKVPMSKVDWSANKDYEYINNYKILQKAFTGLKIDRHIEVDKLIRGKYQDNLEFMQWYKRFYELNGGGSNDYDPIAQRDKGKGGAAYTSKYKFTGGGGGSSASSTTSSSHAAPAAKRRPTAASTTTKSSARPPSAPSSIEKERAIASKRPSATSNAEVEELTKENESLSEANGILRGQIEGLEKERDFYFGKLRDIELLLQELDEAEHTETVKSIFNILYAAEGDFVAVEGEEQEDDDMMG